MEQNIFFKQLTFYKAAKKIPRLLYNPKEPVTSFNPDKDDSYTQCHT